MKFDVSFSIRFGVAMAANVPNSADFQAQVGRELVALRDAFAALVSRNDYVAQMGGATFLQTVLTMSAGDATAMVATLGNHASLSTHYNGGAQAPTLNYRLNGAPFWGGN